jgi:Major Facilitator Superfamily
MRTPAGFDLLRERRFACFFYGRSISIAGSSLAGVALVFAVLDLSNSATTLGAVLAARTVPMILFMLIGGVVADRWSRSLVLQLSHLLSAATQGSVAVLLLSGVAEIWMIVVLEALNGVVTAFTFPALQSVVPLVVERERIQQANALLSFSRGVIVIVGPSLGALVAVTFGSGWALAADALSYVLAAAFMARLGLPAARLGDGSGPSMIRELREGWDSFVSLTWVWIVVLAFGFINVIQVGALSTLGPVVAIDALGKAPWAWALSADAAGLLLMTLVMMRWRPRFPVRAGMLGVCAAAVPILMLGLDPATLPLIVAMFVAGAGTEIFTIGWQTAYHEHVPNEILARVSSYDALGSFVAIPIGQLAYGPLAVAFDPGVVLVVSAVAYVAIALSTLLSPSVRNLGRGASPNAESAAATTVAE